MINETFVYFLATSDRTMVKIGWSAGPKGRLSVYSGWSPVPLELIATAPGNLLDERALHSRFKHHHSHREWFRGAPELLALAEKIVETGEIPLEYRAEKHRHYPSILGPRPSHVRTPEQREHMKKVSKERWDGIRASRALWTEIDRFLIASGMPMPTFLAGMGWLPPFVQSYRNDHPYFERLHGDAVRAFIKSHEPNSDTKAA